MTTNGKRSRAGRPPDTDSAETRRRIIDVARTTFAERGYESTTNRLLGAESRLTAGAIYHHYGSKLELYVVVHDDALQHVFERFAAVIAEPSTFHGKLDALLEEAHEMNVRDPSLARFLGAARVDIQRNPQIREALAGRETIAYHLVEGIVDVGIGTGEVLPADRSAVIAMLRAFLVGLTDAVSDDNAEHRDAIDGMMRLIEGRLIQLS